MAKFTIELISEKPKSKEDKKTEITKTCTNEQNHRHGECSYMACPIYNPIGNWESKNGKCNYRNKTETKEVEGGMEELAKFIKNNGLGKDGKKLTDMEVAEIIAKLDEDEVVKLTDQDKEWMAGREGLAEINKKLGEDEKFTEADWEKYYPDETTEQTKCGNCGANHTKEEAEIGHCWYCGAKLEMYNEEDISDELIQYTIIYKDGRIKHKWLTQKEYNNLWKGGNVTSMEVTK